MSDNSIKYLVQGAVVCTTILACAYVDAFWPALAAFIILLIL